MRYALRNSRRGNVFVSSRVRNGDSRVGGAQRALRPPRPGSAQLYSPGEGQGDETVLTVAWMQKGNAERKCVPEMRGPTIPALCSPATRGLASSSLEKARDRVREIAALTRCAHWASRTPLSSPA